MPMKIIFPNSSLWGHKRGHLPTNDGGNRLIITGAGLPEPFYTEAQDFVKGKPTYFTVNLQSLFDVPAPQENKEKATA